jgi:hypothetical protein
MRLYLIKFPILWCLCCLIFSDKVNAQVGGDHVFEFVNLPSSARISALGGNLITVRDDDLALSFANPALLNPTMDKAITFNHDFHFADIHNGYAAFGKYVEKIDMTFHGGIQYITYGKFDLTDDRGNILGNFKSNEFAFTVGASRQINERMAVGSNLKFVTSRLESYHSLGLLFDLGGVYFNEEKDFTFSIVLKNIGAQLSTYAGNGTEPAPFDFQMGISQKLKHLPFRFSIIAHSLNRWNLLYDNPNSEEQGSLIIGADPDEPSRFSEELDNFFRHIIFNGEFLLGKAENVRLRFGYSHRLKKELSVAAYRSLAGFSAGFGLKINRFRIDYGFGVYHLAGSTKHISISTNIDSFTKNRIIN